jgi:hypothetical protein
LSTGHAPRAARRANAAPLATERHQCVARAGVAGEAQEALGENAAVEIRLEFVFDEWRQALYFGGEGLIVPLHQPVERGVLGAPSLVAGRAGGGCALWGCAHG